MNLTHDLEGLVRELESGLDRAFSLDVLEELRVE